MKNIYNRLCGLCPQGNIYETTKPSALANQILDYWDYVYQDSLMYQMISCAIHVDKNSRLFTRGDALDILKEIEDEVIKESISKYSINNEQDTSDRDG